MRPRSPSVAFVTNFCAHYRVATFTELAERLDVEFLFFSQGAEWYWPSSLPTRRGPFPHRYLRGLRVGPVRVTPSLPWRLARGRYSAIVKCINGRFALPVTYLTARLLGRPFILWTGIWHRLGTRFHRLAFPLTRWIYRHADAVVVYGSHVERFLIDQGVAAERIFIAPHAVDNELYRRPVGEEETRAVRDRLGVAAGAPIVLFVGRLHASKGIHVLLRAFARLAHREATLVVVGEGPERDRAAALARGEGIAERVRFCDPVPPEEVVPLYAAADALVLPSLTTPAFREPWGLVVNEAFNQALPVVASDAVGAAAGGLVEDGVTGLVVPEGDVGALAGALDRLLADPGLREALGAEAHRRVTRWSNDAMVEGFREALDAARGRRGRR